MHLKTTLNTLDPRDCVEDPWRALSEDSIMKELIGNTPLELGSLVDRRENYVVGSEDTNDEDMDLEKLFLKEMDTLGCGGDSNSESDYDKCMGGLFGSNSHGRKRGKVGHPDRPDSTPSDQSHTEDTCSTVAWSQFMSSAEEVLRYMKKTTAEVLDASGLNALSMREEYTPHGSSTAEASENEQENTRTLPIGTLSSTNAKTTCFESWSPLPAADHDLWHMGNDLTTLDTSVVDASARKRRVSNDVALHAPVDIPFSTECFVAAARQPDITPNVSVAKRSTASDGNGHVEHGGLVGKVPAASCIPHAASVSLSPARQTSPILDSGVVSTPAIKGMDMPSAWIPATPPPASTTSRGSVRGDLSVHEEPSVLIDEQNIHSLGAELEADCTLPRQCVEGTSQKLEKHCVYTGGGTPAVAEFGSQFDAMASVGDAEVARRIAQGKTQSVHARRQQRKDNIKKLRLERSVTAFQAIWRGSCTRAQTTPALADRRREVEEKIRMLQEERLAERVVALEAEQLEQELNRQLQESHSMRCEDERTHAAWVHLRRLTEAARGEELVRMRAEERLTRALLDLEHEDLRRVEMAHREEEEAVRMRSEDLEMRELKRVTEAQSSELASMGEEDILARASKNFEDHQLSLSRAEACEMAVEDCASSAWNAERRSQLRRRVRQAWVRSTPVQRAMDPGGIAAARALLRASSPESQRNASFAVYPESAESERSATNDSKKMLATEQTRRRECCKHHLPAVYAGASRLRKNYNRAATTTKTLGITFVGLSDSHDSCITSREEASLQGERTLPVKERLGPAERDGAERELAMDMLSHLGPLQDLTELDLCVEGLTSASLLRACTSLKSLSLNVNRLSSPAGLVQSTSLVRLGLRDNRLSSLQGLSGLPCLRELRLDINHLTSLHELKRLPALVELSANTNHIQELPKGFAIGLMSAEDPFSDRTHSPPASVEMFVACGGLQKLELYHNRIHSVHPQALQGLGSLTHLDLGRNQLRTLNGQGLESCPALSTLILSQNLLREPPFPLCLPLLNELWLSGNQISTMGAWASRSSTKVSRSPSSTLEAERCNLRGSPEPRYSMFCEREPRGRGNVTSCGLDNEREREKHDGTPETEDDEEHSDFAGVWLPSLEVLHLQDNALETLGGRWSLAGCPFLRSVDASFNRLGTPADAGVSLETCSELEEVRLHDNPASLCQNYADALVLSCPNLKRMDGVPTDAQAHWRAGLNAYGRRADLILPFLLSTDEVGGLRGGVCGVATPSPAATGEPIGDRVLRPTTSRKECLVESCPWCGAASPGIKHADEAVTYSVPGDSGVGERYSVGDEERKTKGPSRHRGLPEHTHHCVGEDTPSGRSACASCGFTLSQTKLWSLPESSSPCLSVKWEDVCSAGDRWSKRVSLGSSVNDTVLMDMFRAACLRGRDEHASLRQRHRREERELTTVLNGRELRSLNGGADRMSRLAPAAPSKRRLARELELGERHSNERRDLAVRQLRFHGDGVYQRGAHGIDGPCVVLDEKPYAMQQDQHEIICPNDDGGEQGRDVSIRPASRHDWAAMTLQRFWHRRRAEQQAASPATQGVDSRPRWPVKEQAVTKLQSAFRGVHVRRALQAALASARYVDDELEGLLNMDGGGRFDLDRFLSPPPELRDGWWQDSTISEPEDVKNVRRNPFPPSRGKAEDTTRAVSGIPLRSKVSVAADAILAGQGVELKSANSLDQAGRTPRSGADGQVVKTQRGGNPRSGIQRNAAQAGGRGGGHARGAGIDLGRAWGLENPSVVRSMLKRAKRLRIFQTSEARREKLKDPTVRFEAFVRNVGERERETSDSSKRRRGNGPDAHRFKGGKYGWGQGLRASGALVQRNESGLRVTIGTSYDDALVTSNSVGQQVAKGPVQPCPPVRANRRRRGGGGSLLMPSHNPQRTTLTAHDLGTDIFFEESTPRSAS